MILITGGSGQLGYDLIKECQKRNLAFLAPSSSELNLLNEESVQTYFLNHEFTSIIHSAAYTAVDLAEDEQEKCHRINVDGTRFLFEASKKQNAKFLLVSTDYVFDGTKETPYNINDVINPIGVYARSKAEAEKILDGYPKAYIARISWVFGINGKNFVKTMLRIGIDKEEVSVVSDQYGSPTYTVDAAKTMIDLIQSEKYGIYHITNEGDTHWANFAKAIFSKAGYSTQVKEILTQDYPTKAKRPSNSRLSKQSLIEHGFKQLPTWEDALDRYIVELKSAGELK